MVEVERINQRHHATPVSRAALSAGTTAGWLLAVFIGRELAIAVLVECLQGGARFCEFCRVDDAVVTEVERIEEKPAGALTTAATGSALIGRLATRRTITAIGHCLLKTRVLRKNHAVEAPGPGQSRGIGLGEGCGVAIALHGADVGPTASRLCFGELQRVGRSGDGFEIESDLLVSAGAREARDGEVINVLIHHEELPHHAAVFVMREVAVIHERMGGAGEVIELRDDAHGLALRHIERVLPALLIRCRLSISRHLTDTSRDDVELHIVDVEGVTKDRAARIRDGPLLDRVQLHGLVEDGRCERRVVQRELAAATTAGESDGA